MKFIYIVCFMFAICGCGNKSQNTLEITGLKEIGKINVLYVSIAETMKISSKSGRTWEKWLVRGGAYYQIDLRNVQIKDEGNCINVTLAEPSVYPVANMGRSKPFASGKAMFVTDKALNQMTRHAPEEANRVVAKAACGEEYMSMAKDQAKNVLQQMMGGRKISVKWTK